MVIVQIFSVFIAVFISFRIEILRNWHLIVVGVIKDFLFEGWLYLLKGNSEIYAEAFLFDLVVANSIVLQAL